MMPQYEGYDLKAPWWPRDKKDPRLWMANRKGEVLEIEGNPSKPIDAKRKMHA